MPLITAIQLQKNGKFANLFIDGQFRLGIDLLTVTKEKLKVGKEISNQKINMLLVDSIQTKMLNACLNFLSFRPRSEKEMRIYLDKKAKKYTSIINQKPLVEEIINKLNKLLPKKARDNIDIIDISKIYKNSDSRLIKKTDLWNEKITSEDLYLPYRNLLFLSVAVAYAQTRK